MFPSLDLDEVFNEISNNENKQTLGKSFKFDFTKGDFVIKDGRIMELENKEAIKMWIEKLLKTDKFKAPIYEEVDYGVNIRKLIMGKKYPIGFVNSELKREITEEITKHPNIIGIENFTSRQEGYTFIINFTVVLSDNSTFEQEVAIDG